MHIIDAKKLLCPMPVIHLSEKIIQIKIGEKIKVIATDVGVKYDIPAWCKIHQHHCQLISENTDEIVLLVTKK